MVRFNRRLTVGAVLAVGVLAFARMGYAKDTDLVSDAHKTIALYKKADPGIATLFFESSAGYAVFPGIGKGGIGIGGAHGTGVLFEHAKAIGKVTLNQVTVGAQLGGQEFSE